MALLHSLGISILEIETLILSHIEPIYRGIMRSVCKRWSEAIPPQKIKTNDLELLIDRNHISLLEYLHSFNCISLLNRYNLIHRACELGNKEALNRLLPITQCLIKSTSLVHAINSGLSMVKYLFSINNEIDLNFFSVRDNIVKKIIKKGNIELLEYFKTENKIKFPSTKDEYLEYAYKCSPIHMIRYLNRKKEVTPHHLSLLSKRNSIDTFKYGIELGYSPSYIDMRRFSKKGNLEIVSYLYDKGIELNRKTLKRGSKSGSLPLIKYIISKGVSSNESCLNCGAKYGYIEIVKYYIQLGHIPNSETFIYAVRSENLELIKYLKPYIGSFQELDLNLYFSNDSIILYLVENGYRVSDYLKRLIVRKGYLDLFKSFYSKGLISLSSNLYAESVFSDSTKIAKYLYSIGCPYNPSEDELNVLFVTNSSMYGNDKVLNFLRSKFGRYL